jgi:hypothetical protein
LQKQAQRAHNGHDLNLRRRLLGLMGLMDPFLEQERVSQAI